jgi:hypothetical protein
LVVVGVLDASDGLRRDAVTVDEMTAYSVARSDAD